LFPCSPKWHIVAILEVYYDGSEFSSSLAVSFAKEFTHILNSSRSGKITFITDGVSLQVYDGNNSTEIYKLFDDGKKFEDLSKNLKFDYKSLPNVSYNELIEARISVPPILRS
jgi:hypothetical protein